MRIDAIQKVIRQAPIEDVPEAPPMWLGEANESFESDAPLPLEELERLSHQRLWRPVLELPAPREGDDMEPRPPHPDTQRYESEPLETAGEDRA